MWASGRWSHFIGDTLLINRKTIQFWALHRSVEHNSPKTFIFKNQESGVLKYEEGFPELNQRFLQIKKKVGTGTKGLTRIEAMVKCK